MNGFSENDASPEIGHLYGLRWFQLDFRAACTELTYRHDTVDVTSITDAGRVMPEDGVTIECSCGATCHNATGRYRPEVDIFLKTHNPAGLGSVPVLKGARDSWEPGENVARCLVFSPFAPPGGERHTAPVRGCGCGYWAYWHLGQQQTGDPHVVAIVKGYGKVIQGSAGFRCSHAKIIAMFIPGWSDSAALALEARYGEVYSSLGAMLLRHPAPDGQPALADAYYTTSPTARMSYTITPTGGGWNRQNETAIEYARRIGMATALAPCRRCGAESACPAGTYFCEACAHINAQEAARTLSGQDALKRVHERRESWASGTTVNVTPGYTYTFPGNVTSVGGGGGMGGSSTVSGCGVSGCGCSSGGNGQPYRFGPVSVSGSFSAKLTKAQVDLIKKIFKSGGQDEV